MVSSPGACLVISSVHPDVFVSSLVGIEPDADLRTIKLAYRKMALQYRKRFLFPPWVVVVIAITVATTHPRAFLAFPDPDKWKSDSGHGMSRKEAEDRFKAVQTAYDHMMSNFDD